MEILSLPDKNDSLSQRGVSGGALPSQDSASLGGQLERNLSLLGLRVSSTLMLGTSMPVSFISSTLP